jgi:hypothetical protein
VGPARPDEGADLRTGATGNERQDVQHPRSRVGTHSDEQRPERDGAEHRTDQQQRPLAEAVDQPALDRAGQRAGDHGDAGDRAGQAVRTALAGDQDDDAEADHRDRHTPEDPGGEERTGTGTAHEVDVGLEHEGPATP